MAAYGIGGLVGATALGALWWMNGTPPVTTQSGYYKALTYRSCPEMRVLQAPKPECRELDSIEWSDAKLEQVQESLRRIANKYGIPGVIYELRMNASNYYFKGAMGHNYRPDMLPPGVQNSEINKDSFFEIGSVTKSMTASCMVLLSRAGKFKLSDKLSKWKFGQTVAPYADDITVLQMLNMTSGLNHYENSKQFTQLFDLDPKIHWSPLDLIRWAQEDSLTNPPRAPGTNWEYCNTGYIYAGLIIEKETGLSLADAFKTLLFEPLGMKDSYLAYESNMPEPHPQMFGNERGKLENTTSWNPSWGWSAGAVVSTLRDMSIWAKNLGESILLLPESQAFNKYTPFLLNPSSIAVDEHFTLQFYYGLGLVKDNGWLFHNGSIPGSETIAAYHIASHSTVVLNINQSTLPDNHNPESPVTEMFREVVKILTPESQLHAP